MAGLATAWQLGELGLTDVVVLEAEPLLAMHASARNAAIFLPLEESASAVRLAARTRDLLDARLGTSWLSATGVALVAGYTEPLDELRYTARKLGVFHERWGALQIESRLPLLAGGDVHHALHLPLGGVMDVHMVLSALERWARARGARIHSAARVAEVEVRKGRIAGVQLEDGRRIACERVVMAAGAWSGPLAERMGAPLELTPMRRHLVLLASEQAPRWNTPVVWRVDDTPTYFRPEAGGVLASPCDESEFAPGIPTVDESQLEQLAIKLQSLSPELADAQVRRVWACLRTMTEDREPVVGADARVQGLYWLAGLGGRGMTCGVAAGELLACTMVGLPHPLSRTLGPSRLL